jgi:5-methylcytosine-specific restriction protein A
MTQRSGGPALWAGPCLDYDAHRNSHHLVAGGWICDACYPSGPPPNISGGLVIARRGSPLRASRADTPAPGVKPSPERRPSACRRGYGRPWRAIVRDAIAVHVRVYGHTCPGWGVPAHFTADLTGDHVIPVALGGLTSRANVQILCRACNSRKGRQPATREQLTLDLADGTGGGNRESRFPDSRSPRSIPDQESNEIRRLDDDGGTPRATPIRSGRRLNRPYATCQGAAR